MKPKAVFTESQKFTQWWIWLIIIALLIIPGIGIYLQIFQGVQFGNKPMSDTGLLIYFGATVLFILLFLMMRLKTAISSQEIHLRFVPFVNKHLLWSEVEKAEVINYGFVGGWGIRWWTSYGTVYNMKGSKGLSLEFKSGKKMVIGTQKAEELKKVVEDIRKNQTS